jgi:hypothetical protein
MKAQLDREFREFMHARWPTMVRLAYGLTGDLGHAEDVAQIATAIPFNDPGDMAFSGPGSSPGQHGLARASKVIFSGRADGSSVRMTAYQDPWGICVQVSGYGTSFGCGPVYSVQGPGVACWSSGILTFVFGEVPVRTTRVVLTLPEGPSTQVRPVRVGEQNLFAATFSGTAGSLSWKAYDSSGAVVSSGTVPVSPPPTSTS